MLSGVPVRAATMFVMLQRPRIALAIPGCERNGSSGAEGKIVDGVGIDDMASVKVSRGALAGHAGGILRIVRISAARASWSISCE